MRVPPPLQVPLVVGGVLIGRNLGRILGTVGGKIASDFVNNFIADNVIGKFMVKNLYSMLVGNISKASTSAEVICRSDICSSGSVEYKCKCVSCNGPMQYSDRDGLSSCKTCQVGSYPLPDYNCHHIRCRKCPSGTIGKSDGKCHDCNEPMKYGDKEGATSGKNCSLGQIPLKDIMATITLDVLHALVELSVKVMDYVTIVMDQWNTETK